MKIWYSGIPANWGELDNLCPKFAPILVSYYHNRKKQSFPGAASELFLDSGAFSAKKKNETLSVDEYCKYVHEHGHKFTTVAALDVIGNPGQSWDNYLAMLSNGLNPLPAFHIGSDLKWLKLYADKTDYIALGGIAKQTRGPRFQFLNQVFQEFPRTKFHGFGVTSVDVMRAYPWDTVDSTRATVVSYTGGILSPFGEIHISTTSKSTKNLLESPLRVAELREWVESIGRSWDAAILPDMIGTVERFRISVAYFESIKDEHPEHHTTTQQFLF